MKARLLEKPLVSLLVSVTEPARELGLLVREAARALAKHGLDHEVLFLLATDDFDTVARLRTLQVEDPGRVRVLEFAATADPAALLGVATPHARGSVLLTLPARPEVHPDTLPELYDAIQAGADLAWAARPDRPRCSRWLSRAIGMATGSHFEDVASATRALRPEVLAEIPLYGDFHRYLPVLAERQGFRVREIPARRHPRSAAPALPSAELFLWRAMDVLSVFFVARFTRHPLRLFGGIGAGFAALGFALLVVIGAQRLLGTPLADRPILVLATLLVGLGVQAGAIGLLGELLLFFHARSLRDYRVSAVFEAETPALPPSEARGAGEGPSAG